MGARLRQIPDEAIFDERDTGFSAVVIYDDEANAERAKEIFDRICVRLPDTATMRLHLWPFDALSAPGEHGWVDATDVDAIIVSVAGIEPLPVAARAALERWASETSAARFGFVTLLASVTEREKARSSPVHKYMNNTK